MCGIVGAFEKENKSDQSLEDRLARARSWLERRGPDAQVTKEFPLDEDGDSTSLYLAHTRLSIIDLSDRGTQPMVSSDGRYAITFNGEIYNYRELREELESLGRVFDSDTDSEVLLESWSEWGASVLEKLVGMYAFAVYDQVTKRVTLVRDAFGIKPLFYNLTSSSFCFSSEVPSILELIPAESGFNLQQIYDYLAFGVYDQQPETFFKEVYQLLPGHTLTVDLRTLHDSRPERWWWPSIRENSQISFDDAAAKLRELFLKSVKLHLRSDVPLGAALSGGLDSSSIVCAMRYLDPEIPINTFSFIAPGAEVDEEHWADVVNNFVNAESNKVSVQPNELVNDLHDMILAQGEPFGSTSIYAQYRVYKLARESGITVTLDGQGADELLAGYNGYPSAVVQSMLDKFEVIQALKFIYRWSRWPGRNLRLASVMFLRPLVPKTLQAFAYKLIGRSPSPPWLDEAYLKEGGVRIGPPAQPPDKKDEKGRRLAATLRRALTGGGLIPLLRHGDRNSMNYSLESRVPFLTIELAEFLLSLPERYLVSSDGETKKVFRAAMRGIVPDEILDRRDKIGFQTPEREWLRKHSDELKGLIGDMSGLPFLKTERSRKHVYEALEGLRPIDARIWCLINICAWGRTQGR